MKKEDKEVLYNLFKTADSYLSGYTRQKYAVTPVFSDDVEPEQDSASTTEPVAAITPEPTVTSSSNSEPVPVSTTSAPTHH